jgi:putative colanic acid biosynthesis UDP-glucose lipid carrier transferase
MTNLHKSNIPTLVFWDVICLSFAFFVSLYFFRVNISEYPQLEVVLLLGLILLWLFIGHINHLYVDRTADSLFRSRMTRFFKTHFILASTVGIVYLLFTFPNDVRNLLIAVLAGIPTFGIIINALIIRIYMPIVRHRTKIGTTLIAGSGSLAKKVASTIESNRYTRLSVQGFIDCSDTHPSVSSERVVTRLDGLKEYLKYNYADEIIIALPFYEHDKIKSLIEIADYHGTRIRFVPDYHSIFGENFKTHRYGEIELVNVRQIPLDHWFPNLSKNTFDILFAFLMIILLSPLLVLISMLIKIDSPGPILYTPIRVGRGGIPFKIYKFRSMRESDSPMNGVQSTRKDDPRITNIGRFIRKYSIDELPQFINVLTGEMSVVGPRPHRTFLNQLMQESEEKYMIRHYYKPGITGWAQVNGWRGPTDTDEQKKQRTAHDLWYLKNWTLWLDFKIVWLTVFGKKTHNSAF